MAAALGEDAAQFLAREGAAWLANHAGLMGIPHVTDDKRAQYMHVPFSLVPSSVPRRDFDSIVAVAPVFNTLVDAVSRDGAYLERVLRRTAAVDDFTRRLLDVYVAVHAGGGPVQRVSLGINRADYMLDGESSGESRGMKMVEINTIAAGLGPMTDTVRQMQTYLIERFPGVMQSAMESYGAAAGAKGEDARRRVVESVAPNEALSVIVRGMQTAHTVYGVPTAVILFIVSPAEFNTVDQRRLEYELWDRHRIRVVRATLTEIHDTAKLVGEEKRLFASGGDGALEEVAVVYFRCGYAPTDYPTGGEWAARVVIESSRAIKCPSIGYHIMTLKKIQQELAVPGVIEAYLPPAEAAAARAVETGLWSLDDTTADDSAREAVRQAVLTPERFVMKPQLEGGGHNFYGANVKLALETMTREQLAAHILMARIFPRQSPAAMVVNGRATVVPCLSEIGIFGVYVGDGEKVLMNEYGGYLMRTKGAMNDEGGVASGYAVLDTPSLCD